MKHLFLFVILLLSLNVNSQITQKDSTQYAEVFFYRAFIPKMNAPIKKVPIYINGKQEYELKANSIISKKLYKEGKIRVAIDDQGETNHLINVSFGTSYYFKCEVINGLWFGKPIFQMVTPETGKAECETLTNKLKKK